MKCPKCNYTSFDFNRACPKCGNDNTEEQTRLNLSPNKPNPPFFLASLMGTEGSLNLEIPSDGTHIPSSGAASEEMDAQELLIALDDLQSDNAKPDSPEPLDPSTDEIVFDTDDSKEDALEPLEPFDSEEDEILFDLEPASGEDEVESIGIDPLDKKGFSDFDAPDEKPVAVEAVEIQEETDLFLTDESVSPEVPTEETDPAVINDTFEDPDSPELFLSLDDLPDGELKPEPSEPIRVEKNETQPLFLEETEDKADEVALFLADESTEPEQVLDKKAPVDMKNKPDDSQELFLSLDDLPGGGLKPEPSVSTRIEENDIAFELEKALNQEETPDQKDFWNSDEVGKQAAAIDLEETVAKTTDEKPDVKLFSDLDIEPLDLELSLDDMEKKP